MIYFYLAMKRHNATRDDSKKKSHQQEVTILSKVENFMQVSYSMLSLRVHFNLIDILYDNICLSTKVQKINTKNKL